MISSVSRLLFRLALLACLCAVGLSIGRYARRPRPPAPVAKPSPSRNARPPLPTTLAHPPGTALPSTAGLAAPTPPPPPLPRPPRGKLIALLYGGNRHGEVEPCG